MDSQTFIGLDFDIDVIYLWDSKKEYNDFKTLDLLFQYLIDMEYNQDDIAIMITKVVQKDINKKRSDMEQKEKEYNAWKNCFIEHEKIALTLDSELDDILLSKDLGLEEWKSRAKQITDLMKKLKGENLNSTLHNGVKSIDPSIYGTAHTFYARCEIVYFALGEALRRWLNEKNN